MTFADTINKLWNYCDVLRDDDRSYGGFDGQLTFLLFLEMADEPTRTLQLHTEREAVNV